MKARAADVTLEIGDQIFVVTGARATAASEGAPPPSPWLCRFWRNVRTHTLHDPVAYKRREVGHWVIEGELPEPSWYS